MPHMTISYIYEKNGRARVKHSKKIVKDAALGEEPKVDSLRERVYQYLKDAMSAGKLRYGEFLDQDSICETLEVSKTPLRDALIRLEAEGFVTILPRKGVYINPISLDFIKSAYQIIGSIEADCLNEVFNKLTAYHVRQFEASNERQWELLKNNDYTEYYDENSDILTSEEIKELDKYCKERFVEFVPNQNCFGHMSEWLYSDAFRRLSECPEGFFFYGTHMPPSTLNPLLSESFDFVSAQFADLLPLFSSDKVNIGGDEPFELGMGASKAECERVGKGKVYLDFMKRVFAEIGKYGKSPMMWGDVFKEYYAECKDIFPKNVTVLEWGYTADSFTDKVCELYKSAGIKYYLCPGTSLWNTVTGKTDNMLANIKSAVRLGKKHGAEGILLTDWGDGGSCQPLICSLAVYAVGAAYSWNGEAEQDERIVGYLNRFLFGDDTETIGRLIFDLGNYYKCADKDDDNATKVFKALHVQQTDCMNVFEGNYEPLFFNRDFNYLKAEEYERTKSYLLTLKLRLERARLHSSESKLWKRELDWAIGYLIHGCKLGELKASGRQFSSAEIQTLKSEITKLNKEYKALWKLKNKRTGLRESTLRMEALRRKYAAICGKK